MQYDAPATQLTPLVREAGRLVVTDQRVYFQPLHNVTGGSPVLSHPLAAVAAVAHRSSSLRPIGKALLMTACFSVTCRHHGVQPGEYGYPKSIWEPLRAARFVCVFRHAWEAMMQSLPDFMSSVKTLI